MKQEFLSWPTPPSEPERPEPVADKLLILQALQQAILALEELQGPGFLIGGVMRYRIGLILPMLNDALASLSASPAPQPQPLSDEQIDAIAQRCSRSVNLYSNEGFLYAARAVLAAAQEQKA
jgi:hypothetical protein